MRVAGGALGESRSTTGDSRSRGDSRLTLFLGEVAGMGVLGVSLVSGLGSKREPQGKSGDSSTGGASM
jgi:hypothetical protein